MAAALLADLEGRGVVAMLKVAPATAPGGRYAKDRFTIDLDAQTVTCPARLTVAIIPRRAGAGWPASAAPAPSACPPAGAPAAAPVARSAPPPPGAAHSSPPAASGIPPDGPTTARTAPPWNANSRTCSAAGMAGGAPARAGCCGSGRTGGCWPPRSTSPAWPCSACTPNQVGGRWHRRRPNQEPIQDPSAHRQGPTTIADNIPRRSGSVLSTPIGHQRPRNVVDGLAGCLLPPVAGYAGRSPRYRCSELLAWLRRDRK
jgi:hypothetical protein